MTVGAAAIGCGGVAGAGLGPGFEKGLVEALGGAGGGVSGADGDEGCSMRGSL
ncbi:MAG: hypothetical protein IT379_01010 [Deltaproteobacteria bacterium]|nr:hypothetical protein [Deltaproteobacteria bacterium]